MQFLSSVKTRAALDSLLYYLKRFMGFDKPYVTPLDYLPEGEDFNPNADHTSIVQQAIDNTEGFPVSLPANLEFNVTKLVIRSGLRMLGPFKTSATINWLPLTPSNLHSAGLVSVTKGETRVNGTGNGFTTGMKGRCFKLDSSECLYTIVDVLSSSILEIQPAWEGDTQNSVTYKVYDHFGLLEMPKGIVSNVSFEGVKFVGHYNNPEGWLAYFRSDKTGHSASGLWKALFKNCEAVYFSNGIWFRGTAGDETIANKAYNNSLEPNQFITFENLIISNTGDGDKLRCTGQVNQIYGHGGQFGSIGVKEKTGVGIRFDREPFALYEGPFSSKVPQGFDVFGLTLQFCEFGIKAYGGNALNFKGTYFEHIRKVLDVQGYANSNRVLVHLVNPNFRGEVGTNDESDNFLVRAGYETHVTIENPNHIGGRLQLPAYIQQEGCKGLEIKGPVVLNGVVTGLPSDFVEGVVPTLEIIGGLLKAESHRVIELDEFKILDTIESNLAPGETITLCVNATEGLRVVDGGNIVLPHNRETLRATRDTFLRFVRTETGYKMEEVYSPKNFVVRGSSFVMDGSYRNTVIHLTGGVVEITLPDSTTTDNGEDFEPGEEINVYLTGTAGVSFVAGGNATIHANKLESNRTGGMALVSKGDGDDWTVSIIDNEPYTPRKFVERGSDFVLPFLYRDHIIHLTGTAQITLPDATSTEGSKFVAGDEITVYLTSGTTMSFVGGGSANVYANKLSTNVTGAMAKISKGNGQDWTVTITE